MRTKIWILLSVTAALAVAGGAIVLASPASSTIKGSPWGAGPSSSAAVSATPNITTGKTIDVYTRTQRAEFVDANDSGMIDFGDYDVFTESLESRSGTPMGHDRVTCTIFSRAFTCRGTFTLTGWGDITVDGSVREGALAVTGGTARFSNARGQAVFSIARTRVHFRFQLIP